MIKRHTGFVLRPSLQIGIEYPVFIKQGFQDSMDRPRTMDLQLGNLPRPLIPALKNIVRKISAVIVMPVGHKELTLGRLFPRLEKTPVGTGPAVEHKNF
jgi:hypothetical protein